MGTGQAPLHPDSGHRDRASVRPQVPPSSQTVVMGTMHLSESLGFSVMPEKVQRLRLWWLAVWVSLPWAGIDCDEPASKTPGKVHGFLFLAGDVCLSPH